MDFEEQKDYIVENINELRRTYRIEALQLILGSNIDRTKIREKGGGTEIRMSDLSPDIIDILYNYIKTKIMHQVNELSRTDITLE